ncbi:MAG: hypothetical protein QE285_07480 [Aquabacterium sp.]|nr:hypothetical protein [Aquabacterium sp.]
MLLGNYSVLNKGPGRFFGGSTTSAEVQVPSNWQKSGAARNSLYVSGATTALVLYAIPSGNYAGSTWMLPQKSGEMSSRNDMVMSFTAGASGLRGVTTTGTATMAFPVADMTGGLITSGAGSASFAINGNGNLLASLSAVGSASLSINTNTPILGAKADLVATALMTFSGTLVPYAVGNMQGSTISAAELTTDAIAGAVWSRVVEAGYSAEQILRLVAAHAAGAATGLEGGNPQFYGLDGSTVRIDGAYAAGNRTIDALNGGA